MKFKKRTLNIRFSQEWDYFQCTLLIHGLKSTPLPVKGGNNVTRELSEMGVIRSFCETFVLLNSSLP